MLEARLNHVTDKRRERRRTQSLDHYAPLCTVTLLHMVRISLHILVLYRHTVAAVVAVECYSPSYM